MRRAVLVMIVLPASLLLAGCGKPATNADQAASDRTTAAPAAPAPITDAGQRAALATLPVAYQSADLDNGRAKFALCKSCHTLAPGGGAMVGPNLGGVFGRKAGSATGFTYSQGLKASGIVWDATRLDQWIADPRAVVPDTKMSYLGLRNAKDRIDVIAYLKVATSPAAS